MCRPQCIPHGSLFPYLHKLPIKICSKPRKDISKEYMCAPEVQIKGLTRLNSRHEASKHSLSGLSRPSEGKDRLVSHLWNIPFDRYNLAGRGHAIQRWCVDHAIHHPPRTRNVFPVGKFDRQGVWHIVTIVTQDW